MGHTALDVLTKYWGFEHFRPGQAPLIEAAMKGRDALGILPTGAGKSICYQVPSLLLPGLTLVISPLVALMEDQTEALRQRGIPAANFSGLSSQGGFDRLMTDAQYGKYRVLFVSPERFLSDRFAARVPSLTISLLAVDEAHCISEWGHDFRPEYRRISEMYPSAGRPPVLALTATATPRVRKDIISRLNLTDPLEIVTSFDRPNISFSVFRSVSKREKVKAIFDAIPGSGIVYAPTRRSVDTWGRILRESGEKVRTYHAGLARQERSAAQHDWLTGDARLMVATNAFGMGVDKAGVRAVVHVGLPMSLEAYYQEAGRAGRDGHKAYAALLYGRKDMEDRRSMIAEMYPPVSEVRTAFDTLMSLNGIAVGSEPDRVLSVDLKLIQKVLGLAPRRIESIIGYLLREGIFKRTPTYSAGFEKIFLAGLRPSRLSIDLLRRRRFKRRVLKQLRDVMDYASGSECRRRRLIAHFDDYTTGQCGMCDNCLGRHEPMKVGTALNETMVGILRILDREHLPQIQAPVTSDSGRALPSYRVEELVDWLSLQGYVDLPENPREAPQLTALGAAVVRD